MFLSAMPVIRPLPAVPMTPQCVQVMRDSAQTFGAAVHQRSVRQETTRARAGTLPSHLYQREVRLGESVSLECSREQRRNEAEEADKEDGLLEDDEGKGGKIWMTSHFLLIMTRSMMMLVEFRRWTARQHFCLERFHVWKNCSLQEQNYSLIAVNC